MRKKQSGGMMSLLAYGSAALAVIGVICFVVDLNFSYREVGSTASAGEQKFMLLLMAGAFFSFLFGLAAGTAPLYSQDETVQGFAMLGTFSNGILLVFYSALTIYACSGQTFVT